MCWLKILVLVTTNMAADVPKYLFVVATDTAGKLSEV